MVVVVCTNESQIRSYKFWQLTDHVDYTFSFVPHHLPQHGIHVPETMLRDIPPFSYHDAAVVMNNPEEQVEAPDQQPPRHDPLGDVFGSAPSSPTLAPSINHGGGAGGNTEHSDVPRLRRIHVTNGYREGIAVSKEEHVQAGFDEGFSLGGEIGMRAGWCLGILEGICQALSRAIESEDGNARRARDMYMQAKEELALEKLLSKDYIGPDGIWKYDVPGQDDVEELSVTFGDVAVQHPVLQLWRKRVLQFAGELGLVLGDQK